MLLDRKVEGEFYLVPPVALPPQQPALVPRATSFLSRMRTASFLALTAQKLTCMQST